MGVGRKRGGGAERSGGGRDFLNGTAAGGVCAFSCLLPTRNARAFDRLNQLDPLTPPRCYHLLILLHPQALLGAADSWRSHRLLRVTITATLPRLAAFCPDAFARSYLGPTLAHLTRGAKPGSPPELRAAAMLALGEVSG